VVPRLTSFSTNVFRVMSCLPSKFFALRSELNLGIRASFRDTLPLVAAANATLHGVTQANKGRAANDLPLQDATLRPVCDAKRRPGGSLPERPERAIVVHGRTTSQTPTLIPTTPDPSTERAPELFYDICLIYFRNIVIGRMKQTYVIEHVFIESL